MKKIMKIFVLVAAAAMALASCQKNEIDNSTSQEYEYTFHIGNADTKATLGDVSVEWTSGDQMGLYTVTTSDEVSYNTKGYINPGKPATMKVYSYNALAAGDMIYAYYPYTEVNAQVPTEVLISLPAKQDGNDDMPMVSLPMVVTSGIAARENVAVEAGEIKLVNLAAIAEFNVYSSNVEYQSEKVKSVSFTANKAIAGNFTFDLTSVDYSNAATLAISGYTDTEVVSTLSTAAAVGTAKESATKVKMVVAPGEGYTGTVVVATDKASYTFNVTKAKTFTRSSVLPLAVDLANGERVENAAAPEGVTTTTISFANTTQRTSYSTNEQVWGNGGVVFTNSKGSSTNNVGDYSNPARFYKGSNISVTAPGNITMIEFDCTGLESKYITPFTDIDGSSNEKGIVTISLDGTSSSVTYTALSAQARAKSLTVTYVLADPTAPSITANDVADISARGAEAAELSYTLVNPDGSEIVVTCDGIVVEEAVEADGAILYSVSKNVTNGPREGHITISYGDIEKVVKVSQNAPVFTSTQTEIVLAANADATKSFTITSDFDWIAELSEDANFTINTDTYEWSDNGKQSVKVTATSENTSEEGTLTLGTITFTNVETEETITVTVKQESSYVEGDGKSVTATLSFADKAQRTTFTTTQQIWEQNGIKVTNNKASSTSNVADYAKPARFYANSSLEVTALGLISEIVFDANSSSYATAMKESIGTVSGATVTVSSDKVTVTYTTPVASFSVAKFSAQVRMDGITVTYLN